MQCYLENKFQHQKILKKSSAVVEICVPINILNIYLKVLVFTYKHVKLNNLQFVKSFTKRNNIILRYKCVVMV